MCNLYSVAKMRSEVSRMARALRDRHDNQPPMAGVYPDYSAPVVVVGEDGEHEIRDMRWGMPSSKKALMNAASKRADKLRAKGQTVDANARWRAISVSELSLTTRMRASTAKVDD